MSVQIINILVVGSRKAEKGAFIRSVSEYVNVDTSESHLPEEDDTWTFGQVKLNEDNTLYLMGFDLLKLSRLPVAGFLDNLREAHGFCLLIDSCDDNSLHEAQVLFKYFEPIPHIVILNKQDRENAKPIEQIRREMDLPAETIILPCVATERASVASALNTLLEMIRPDVRERVK